MSVPSTLQRIHDECGGTVVFRPSTHRRALLAGERIELAAACRSCGETLYIDWALKDGDVISLEERRAIKSTVEQVPAVAYAEELPLAAGAEGLSSFGMASVDVEVAEPAIIEEVAPKSSVNYVWALREPELDDKDVERLSAQSTFGRKDERQESSEDSEDENFAQSEEVALEAEEDLVEEVPELEIVEESSPESEPEPEAVAISESEPEAVVIPVPVPEPAPVVVAEPETPATISPLHERVTLASTDSDVTLPMAVIAPPVVEATVQAPSTPEELIDNTLATMATADQAPAMVTESVLVTDPVTVQENVVEQPEMQAAPVVDSEPENSSTFTQTQGFDWGSEDSSASDTTNSEELELQEVSKKKQKRSKRNKAKKVASNVDALDSAKISMSFAEVAIVLLLVAVAAIAYVKITRTEIVIPAKSGAISVPAPNAEGVSMPAPPVSKKSKTPADTQVSPPTADTAAKAESEDSPPSTKSAQA